MEHQSHICIWTHVHMQKTRAHIDKNKLFSPTWARFSPADYAERSAPSDACTRTARVYPPPLRDHEQRQAAEQLATPQPGVGLKHRAKRKVSNMTVSAFSVRQWNWIPKTNKTHIHMITHFVFGLLSMQYKRTHYFPFSETITGLG